MSFVSPTSNPFQCSKEETGCYDLPVENTGMIATDRDLLIPATNTIIIDSTTATSIVESTSISAKSIDSPTIPIDTPPSQVQISNIYGASVTKKSNRFNHANFDCGSLILATNKEAEGATNILVKSKDQYMLNQCR
jgi:hypothetical protein